MARRVLALLTCLLAVGALHDTAQAVPMSRARRESAVSQAFVNTCTPVKPTLFKCSPENPKFTAKCSCSGKAVVPDKPESNQKAPPMWPLAGWSRMTDGQAATMLRGTANCWACKGFLDGASHTHGEFTIMVYQGNVFAARLESHYDNHPSGGGAAYFHPGFTLYTPTDPKFQKYTNAQCQALDAASASDRSKLSGRADCGQFDPSLGAGAPTILVTGGKYTVNTAPPAKKPAVPTKKSPVPIKKTG